jgi:hypothetical protein
MAACSSCLTAAGSRLRDLNQCKAPRTADRQPDLLRRVELHLGRAAPAALSIADEKVFTKEEFEKRRAGLANAFRSIATFAP